MTMFAMSLYALVSATVVITASTRGHILAGRTLNCKAYQTQVSLVRTTH